MEALNDPNVANHMASSNHEECNDHQRCNMENREGTQLANGPDSDSSQNEGLPETVTVLEAPTGGKVYLVGTAHFSEQSQQDVAETIRKTRPNIVVLELCKSRLNILSLDEKTIIEESQSMSVAKVRKHIQEYGVVQGVMYMLLLSLSAHLTKQLGMAPGGEFRKAYNEAMRIPGCIIHLGDRPVHITLRRAISSLTWWQKMKLGFSIIFNNDKISKEEVEKCKQKDLLEDMLQEMTGEFPAMSRVFVEERDIYLTYSLQMAASPMPCMHSHTGEQFTPAVVVGVVGIGHVPGIVKNWGKVKDSQIPPLLELPKPSKVGTIVRKGVRYTMYAAIMYGAYRYLLPSTVSESISCLPHKTLSLINSTISSAKSITWPSQTPNVANITYSPE